MSIVGCPASDLAGRLDDMCFGDAEDATMSGIQTPAALMC
jgi:hypothetical protein